MTEIDNNKKLPDGSQSAGTEPSRFCIEALAEAWALRHNDPDRTKYIRQFAELNHMKGAPLSDLNKLSEQQTLYDLTRTYGPKVANEINEAYKKAKDCK